ncbi:hypothetical protein OROGR_009256 [Orobanche gracilis]
MEARRRFWRALMHQLLHRSSINECFRKNSAEELLMASDFNTGYLFERWRSVIKRNDKLCELSFDKTRHLRNPYNENLPVKISIDCQELEHSIGEQLASLLYLEPDSDLMAISIAAELKREEASRLKEKATVGQKHG